MMQQLQNLACCRMQTQRIGQAPTLANRIIQSMFIVLFENKLWWVLLRTPSGKLCFLILTSQSLACILLANINIPPCRDIRIHFWLLQRSMLNLLGLYIGGELLSQVWKSLFSGTFYNSAISFPL